MSIVPNGFQDIVNDSNVGVNESTFFSFVCQTTQMNAQKCYWMLILKNAKIVIESDLRANVSVFALMNVSSRCWSSFHANECVFSRNEQQKVYCTLKYANMIRISNISFFRFCWKNGKLDWPKCARTRGYYLCYLMSCDDSSLFRCVTRIQGDKFLSQSDV